MSSSQRRLPCPTSNTSWRSGAPAAVIAPHDPLETFIPATPPGAEHFFGTDRLGRDIFSRLLFGAQSSLMIGLGAVILAILAGALLGSFAATSSKAVNELIMRLMDILMAFPGIALAAVLLAAFSNSVPTIIIAIAIIYTPQLARVVRANVLSQYGEDYVRAERVIGAGRFYILLKHIVRNTAAPVLVFATVMVADAIILEASLSFLGAGVQDPASDARGVFALASASDATAIKAVAMGAAAAGQAVGGLANILDPEVVVVSGGLSDAGAPLVASHGTRPARRTPAGTARPPRPSR